MRARLRPGLADFIMFGLKQAWACLFGALLLAGLLISNAIWREDWPLARYDALLIYALLIQGAFLLFRLESWAEARVIALFHLTGNGVAVGLAARERQQDLVRKVGQWQEALRIGG